jgi:dATP pyrophosphohydrolase
MARAAFQVLVYPYRKRDDFYEYAIFLRTDNGIWQTVAGGGEDDETPLEAARRELGEETGIFTNAPFIQLQTVEPIPVTEFRSSYRWGEELYVISQYCFGVDVGEAQIQLSHEHSEVRWLRYAEAQTLVYHEGNRTALWELDTRLRGKGPRG